ncbi:hypothetical protein [Stakelama tenebrarum]|uniref:Uncharacterized protein n=1 Tax=Stakelama tenebrarum TaxID=2711215 RepID=A0A6G6Y4B5_9SPHN|nr:hypothetical protein [Sphingosinithalassobacter tenebrarum]QIG79453.1 hypothetical protein G5C33_06405 [Sphingosinithalassobacter tenebrarum]QIG79943.1 hypothetical protein G5C33_09245 [Sphingosinithalassobacter tenebrarum]
MAKHSIEVNKEIAGVAAVAAAIGCAVADAEFGFFSNPLVTGLVAGVVGFGIAYSDAKAAGGVILISAFLFLISVFGG